MDSQTQLKAFVEECKLRQSSASKNPGSGGPNDPSSSVASAAGDRVRLGQGPPSKSYADLVTIAEMKQKSENYLQCLDKEDLDELTKSFKPGKGAAQELLTLGNASAKDLKGAVTAANKRVQQEVENACKRRKVTPAVGGEQKPLAMFEFIPTFSGDGKDLCIPCRSFWSRGVRGLKVLEYQASSAFLEVLARVSLAVEPLSYWLQGALAADSHCKAGARGAERPHSPFAAQHLSGCGGMEGFDR